MPAISTDEEGTLRIGLIGAGFIGTTVGAEFHAHPLATVEAIADVSEPARTDAGATFGVPSDSLYDDYETMLERERLDAVLVGTPHTLHYEQVLAALDRGLHVLCDKPLTTDLETARDLVARSESSDATLMVGYQRHLNPAFIMARDRWAGGLEPRWLTASITQNWVDRFSDTWRLNPDLNGGGYLYDTGSHLLDAVLWSTGLRPEAVSARMEFVDDDRRVDGRADLTIRFENGATASVAANGDAPCVREHIHVWDDEGAVYLSGREWEPREYAEIDVESATHTPYINRREQRNKAEAFVDAVREGSEPPATARDGLRVTAVTEAAYESARTGRGEWVPVGLD